MRSLRSICCAALAAAALLAGCGKSDSTTTQKLQLDSFVAKAADTVCSAFARCNCTDSSAVPSCKQAYTSAMMDQLDSQLLAFPGQTLDPVAAQTCLDDMKAELSDCSLSLPPTLVRGLVVARPLDPMLHIPACATAITVGVQAAGERCHVDAECAAGLACNQGTLTCATPAALDGDCGDVRCVDTAWCDHATWTCKALLAAGDACEAPDAWGQPECGTGMDCEYSSLQSKNICAAPVAIDGTCGDGSIPCVAGAYCDVSGLCKALIADGGDCTSFVQCQHGWCNGAGKCEDPGICSYISMKE